MTNQFFIDTDGLLQDAIQIDTAAQKYLALEEKTTDAVSVARASVGSASSTLNGALSNFANAWSLQSRILAIQSAAVAAQLQSTSAAAAEADDAGAMKLDKFLL